LIAAWLRSLSTTHAANTLTTWRGYVGAHWVRFYSSTDDLTREKHGEYLRTRLGEVRAVTVRKELTALRSFLDWCHGEDEQRPDGSVVPTGPLPHVRGSDVPRLPKRASGTPYGKRRRVAAFELSPEQVTAIIEALPEWSERRVGGEHFPIRARFVLGYETSLRPSTLDRLEVPTHYRRGESMLRLTAAADKARWGRDVPLTARAREALDSVIAVHEARAAELARAEREFSGETSGRAAEFTGLVFGHHDYRDHIRKAAELALPRELAERFAGTHLRSARITHLLERPKANLPGVQHLAGHKLMSTTARYVKPSFRAALEALGGEPAESKPSTPAAPEQAAPRAPQSAPEAPESDPDE
jgi:integrase